MELLSLSVGCVVRQSPGVGSRKGSLSFQTVVSSRQMASIILHWCFTDQCSFQLKTTMNCVNVQVCFLLFCQNVGRCMFFQ